MTKIICTNKKEEIIVDDCDYIILNQYTWHINKDGKIKSRIKNIHWGMNRFIYSELMGNEITRHEKIGYINQNKKDNTRINLRKMTTSETNRNMKRGLGNKTSIYKGVSYNKGNDIWITQFKIENGKTLRASYEFELHAAWQYNLWLIEYNLDYLLEIKNDVSEPVDFIPWKKQIKNNNLPTGIYSKINKNGTTTYPVEYYKGKNKTTKTFKNLKEAIIFRKQQEKIREEKRILDIKKDQPLLEKKGVYYINIKGKNILIDFEDYEKISKYRINIKRGYITIYINEKHVEVSRYLMDCYDPDLEVDHINNTPSDNRKCNLRIVTHIQNNYNKSSRINSSSKYLGVSWHKKLKKWSAKITINRKIIHIGYYKTEIEAAKARDVATKKYFGKYGNLNFPELVVLKEIK